MTEAERQACEWFGGLVEEVEATGRPLTDDEIQKIVVHLNLCKTHTSVVINGVMFLTRMGGFRHYTD